MSTRSQYRTRRETRSRRLRVETLERRVLLAADLEITNAFLVDRFNNPISAPVEGELAFVRAEWRTTDLNSSQQYVVHYEMDGITVESGVISGAAGINLPYNWYRGVAFSAPGNRQVRVVVDGDNAISEANESNNEFVFNYTPIQTDFPEKMVLPIGGEPGKDWSFVNYTDVNINSGQRQDFRGGEFQYDGHDALDIALPNFQRMDDGNPILSAASGTVIQVQDGNFDREVVGNNRPANFVVIDHGNGWVAYYFHLVRETVAVEVGQTVSKGQMIGLNGSSGSSTDAHLHFSLYRNGSLVEPMYKPEDYFVVPPVYQGDLPPSITASGITDRAPWDDFKEGPNDIREFRSDGNEDTWFWYRLSHIGNGESLQVEWYRPSGVLDATYNWTANGVGRFGGHGWFRNTRTYEGTWTVILKHAGVELTRESFEVIGSGGGPELDVRDGSTYIIDRRSTPIDFGSTASGNSAITKSFTLSNWGISDLTVSGVDAPDGFQVVSFPSSVAPGGSGLLTVQMTTNQVGEKWGDLIIHTNDSDEGQFRFAIEGEINGSLPAGAATLQQNLPPLAIEDRLPKALFPDLTIGNVTGTDLAGGSVMAKIVSGKMDTDKLVIDSQDVEVDQGQVLYQSNHVANVVSDGSNGNLVLDILAGASVGAIREVARSIHFIDETATPSSRRRMIEVKVADASNVTSNVLRRAAFYSDTLPAIDFGDAPSPYPTLLADDGARHIPIGPRLGAERDIELDGFVSAAADGDDNDGILDDEDGVGFGSIGVNASVAAVNIELQNAANALVDAWIDFNGNGIWESSEQILSNVDVIGGLQTLNYPVPSSGVAAGNTFARVRVSSNGGLQPTGEASDGEVEDYRVTILPTVPQVQDVTINGGEATRSKVTSVEVQFDAEVDHASLSSAFVVTNITTLTQVGAVSVAASDAGGKTTAVLTFSGASTLAPADGSLNTTLLDGNYRLDIDASQVRLASNSAATMPVDYRFGGQTAGDPSNDNFFRQYGDADGDGNTDFLDFSGGFLPAFGNGVGSNDYREDLDFDGDGNVDFLDFSNGFLPNFGTGRP